MRVRLHGRSRPALGQRSVASQQTWRLRNRGPWTPRPSRCAQIVDVDGDLAPDIIVVRPATCSAARRTRAGSSSSSTTVDSGTLSTDDADVTISTGDENHFDTPSTPATSTVTAASSPRSAPRQHGLRRRHGRTRCGLRLPPRWSDGRRWLRRRRCRSPHSRRWRDASGSAIMSADFTGDGTEQLIVVAPWYNEEDGRISVFSLRSME